MLRSNRAGALAILGGPLSDCATDSDLAWPSVCSGADSDAVVAVGSVGAASSAHGHISHVPTTRVSNRGTNQRSPLMAQFREQ